MGRSRPKVIVGLDLGTSFSGFAYALTSEPGELFTPHAYPKHGPIDQLSFNTPTILHYACRTRAGIPTYDLVNWGWSAHLSYLKHIAQAQATAEQQVEKTRQHYLVQHFNFLQLAEPKEPGSAKSGDSRKPHGSKKRSVRSSISTWLGLEKKMLTVGISGTGDEALYHRLSDSGQAGEVMDFSCAALPPGMKMERVISDYLAMLAGFALKHLQRMPKYGPHLTSRMVQWCVTVPAFWDDSAKKRITRCAERAGMVAGRQWRPVSASPHPLLIVLESEAAAVSCSRKRASRVLVRGDKFMVVDMGGSRVEVAVHRQMDDEGLDLMQVAESSRAPSCGGSQVDRTFFSYLAEKFPIPCFDECVRQKPEVACSISKRWEQIKCSFNGSESWRHVEMEIPWLLAVAIKEPGDSGAYCKLEITSDDMKRMFDPVVDKVVELIRVQMQPGIKAVMAVGGFSASEYVVRRIHAEFDEQVEQIISPRDPSSAICRGAVILALHSKRLRNVV